MHTNLSACVYIFTCIPITHSLLAQEQYVLIHDALNDYITCGDTSVVAYQLRMAIHDLDKEEDGQSGFERQFEVHTHYLPVIMSTTSSLCVYVGLL